MAPGYTREVFTRLQLQATGPASMRSLLKEVGVQVAETVARSALAKGGTQFWRDVSNTVTKRVDGSSGVEIGASHVAAAFKEYGGTISAPGKGPGAHKPPRKYLTIPISPLAKKKNVGDFKKGETFIARSKKGNLIIFLKEKTKKSWSKSTKLLRSMMGPQPLYVLKPSVTQKPDPWWPSTAKIDAAINKAGELWIARGK